MNTQRAVEDNIRPHKKHKNIKNLILSFFCLWKIRNYNKIKKYLDNIIYKSYNQDVFFIYYIIYFVMRTTGKSVILKALRTKEKNIIVTGEAANEFHPDEVVITVVAKGEEASENLNIWDRVFFEADVNRTRVRTVHVPNKDDNEIYWEISSDDILVIYDDEYAN